MLEKIPGAHDQEKTQGEGRGSNFPTPGLCIPVLNLKFHSELLSRCLRRKGLGTVFRKLKEGCVRWKELEGVFAGKGHKGEESHFGRRFKNFWADLIIRVFENLRIGPPGGM